MNHLTYKGYWWLPNKKKEIYPGTLQYSPNEGGLIELIINNDIKFWHENRNSIDIILGLANNTEITLCKCECHSEEFNNPSIFSFGVETIICGHHFKDQNSIKIQNCFIEFNNLNNWVLSDTYTIELRKTIKSIRRKPFTILPKKKYRCVIDNNLSINFVIGNSIKPSINNSEYRIFKDPFFEVKYKHKVSFLDLMKHIDQLQKFVCFGIQNPIYIKSFQANKRKITGRYELKLFTRRRFTGKIIKDRLQRSDMLFCFEDVEKKFSNILLRWFNNFDNLENLHILYFSIIYGNIYLQLEFLTIIQILESFHRKFFPKSKPKIPKPEFRKRKNNIIKNIPKEYDKSEYMEWLNENLNNQPSLRERLEYIFERFNKILFNFNDKEIFMKVVVDTRNLMSHALNTDEITKQKYQVAKEYHNLYNLYLKTKMLVDICLLDNLGLSNTEIINNLKKYWKYEIIHNGKDYFNEFSIITPAGSDK
jgi:hypothetical protein